MSGRGRPVVWFTAMAVTAISAYLIVSKLPLYFSERSVPQDSIQRIERLEKAGAFDFSLKTLESAVFSLRTDSADKIVLLNFWASWCAPCIEEFPAMIKLARMFPNDILIVAVSEDEVKEDSAAFVKAIGEMPSNFKVLMDEAGKVRQDYGVEKLPESFIFGKDMKLRKKVVGSRDWFSEDVQLYFHQLISAK